MAGKTKCGTGLVSSNPDKILYKDHDPARFGRQGFSYVIRVFFIPIIACLLRNLQALIHSP